MSIEEHRTTVMEEARARAAAREAAPPSHAPPARRPTPMLNTGVRTPLVPRMTDGSLPSIQLGHIVAAIIVAVFLLALGLSISGPRQSEGPTLVWPTIAPSEAPQPSAPVLRPTSGAHPTEAPTVVPTAASYLKPVSVPQAVPTAPQAPGYIPSVPAPPPAPAELQPIADLVPIPTAAPAPTNGVWSCSDASAARPCRGSGGQP